MMRFQKILSGCIALLILVAQMGVALHVHYCAGEIAAVETLIGFSESSKDVEENCCGALEEASKKKPCCSDKQVTFKDTSVKVLVKNLTPDFQALFFELPVFYFQHQVEDTMLISDAFAYSCDRHGPPLYQRYSQLIFYA